MFHYRVTIAYKGTHFHGWQAQSKAPHTTLEPTVQGTIYRALLKMSTYEECTITGCSRTDAGVHARGQIGKISIPKDIPAENLLRGLNSVLPDDLRILDCQAIDASFNPQALGSIKEYHYHFTTAAVPNPVLNDVVSHVPGPVDLDLIRQAAALFEGEHDFVNFCRRSSHAATTTRKVITCELLRGDFAQFDSESYYLRVVGGGFLKQMIRYMAAAIFAVGQGRVSLPQLADYLETEYEDKLCPKAKAGGLHLVKVTGLDGPSPGSPAPASS